MITAFSAMPALSQVSPAELRFPHNHLPWFTIESDHFLIHYQEGNSRSAAITSVIGEEIYEPITSLYAFRPEKKVSIIIRDREDFSNGAAFFFDDKIEIWLPALDTPLRGTTHWLRNVITHEFTHLVQLGASMQRSSRIPAIYFQWLNYEDVRRPDVLYGFPNGLITKPFATVSIPAWFAEGTAQYQSPDAAYDRWDTHRDMILRTALLTDSWLSFDEMGTFTSKNSLEREQVYNQGYGFVLYLTERFGPEVVAEITKTASEGGRRSFSNVMKRATGYSGSDLFTEWIDEITTDYTTVINELSAFASETVHHDGFFNFHPQYSPDGSHFAWLSNKGQDAARTRLYLSDGSSVISVDKITSPDRLNSEQSYLMQHGLDPGQSVDAVSHRYSFSPEGYRLAYSRPVRNRFGENYDDLFIYDIQNKESRRITRSERVRDPAWAPDGTRIAAVKQMAGTQNLVTIDPADGSITTLTSFENGETVYTPAWHPDGNQIIYAMARTGSRNIYRYVISEGESFPIFSDQRIDFRDPFVDPDGAYIYFSGDASGIYNIYRKRIGTTQTERLTEVSGGAFMPFVRDDTLYFAHYGEGGYRISRSDLGKRFHSPLQPHPGYLTGEEPVHPDSEIRLATGTESLKDGDEANITIQTPHGDLERIWRPYSETTTGLSIFPVIRFDNYTKQRGSNSELLRRGRAGDLAENLWRDLKIGAYFESRDVTERLSLFGGALIGPGSLPASSAGDAVSPSRINNLDRDLFLIADYTGLPFIERSWSPTVTLELYNLKRNVQDGLAVEEFPCTSCLPEERLVDIRYSIWEAALYLRSKLNRWSFLELGASYSPYTVSTDGFFSDEFREFIPGSTSRYFSGNRYSLSYVAEAISPTRHADITPYGLRGSFTYTYEPSRLLQEFEVNDGILSPVYSSDRNHSLELMANLGFPGPGPISAQLRTRGFAYLNSPNDFFYLDYIGGLTGIRSYPFFALGGERTAFTRASVLAPIRRNISRQIGRYTLDKVYGSLFAEAGNGWGGPLGTDDRIKTGAGAELRAAFNSDYLFPMKFFLSGAYGFNRYSVNLPAAFISTDSGSSVSYGRELLIHFGLTFDFDLQ